ncbi:MAG TPA: DUF1990 domain-containing protein [Glycomyces sp.]|nr:DUF1990 domain-containing protein [Glycomyces sp.]
MDIKANYPEIGATRTGPLPTGYRHLERTADLDTPLAEAAELLLTWGLQERCGLRPEAAAPRAALGVEFTLHYLGLRLPCQVVWAEETPERVGFGYGTLPGHQERGEAAFLLEAVDGRTRFTLRSFSVPGTLLSRLGTPVVRHLQARATDRYLTVMREACARA